MPSAVIGRISGCWHTSQREGEAFTSYSQNRKGSSMGEKKDHSPTVGDYIAKFPEDVQQILYRIRSVIKDTAPEAVEKISYGMPGYYLNGGLVWFGAYKHHIGLYPWTSEMEAAIEGLSAYKGKETKGSVHFPLDEPMPYELIREIVQFRVAENLNKAGKYDRVA
jgi:uncharacterized protein YdhG (YjbR/CyaY superfamily)